MKGFDNMAKLLIVDDEEKIRDFIKKYAIFEGHSIKEASNGMEALDICKNEKFDLIILDIMMPELDGFSTCKEIKKIDENIPIIMLSARGEEYDKIHGFELGIDDYVVKPFSPKELMMRIDAILKRTLKLNSSKDIFIKDSLIIDFTARIVTVDNKQVDMSPKEYDLLFYLVKNKGIALTREKIITEVWGYDFYGDDRTLDTHIKLLRKSIAPYNDLIVTLRGVGYRFES